MVGRESLELHVEVRSLSPEPKESIMDYEEAIDRSNCSFPGLISIPIGWHRLYANLIEDLEVFGDFAILQAKEKFGGLRVYFGVANDYHFRLLKRYEEIAIHTCQFCGESGELRNINDWMYTICDKCASKI